MKRERPRRARVPEPVGAAKTGRSILLWCLGLIALAFVQRLLFLASNEDCRWPFSIFYEGDAETFFNHAVAIRQGVLYDAGIPFHPPLFPYLLAAIHAIVGVGDASGPAVNHTVRQVLALIGSVPVGLLYALVRAYAGHRVALIAALLATFHFGMDVIAVAPVSEALYLGLLLGALLLWTRARRGGFTIAVAIALGVVLGLLSLTRAEGLFIGAVLLVGLGWRPGARRGALIAAAALALTVTPWAIRNAASLRDFNRANAALGVEPLPTFVPITIYGPLNLALANHSGADGTFSREIIPVKEHGAQLDPTDPEHLRFLLHGDRLAWDFVREHPADWLALVLRKWGLYADVLRQGFTQWDLPGGLRGTRRPIDMFVPESPLGFIITIPLLLAGFIVAWKRGSGARSLVLLTLVLTAASLATTALFFGYARQAILMMPLWLSVGAVGIDALIVRVGGDRGSNPRRVAFAATAIVAVLLIAEGIGARGTRSFNAVGEVRAGEQVVIPDRPLHLDPK